METSVAHLYKLVLCFVTTLRQGDKLLSAVPVTCNLQGIQKDKLCRIQERPCRQLVSRIRPQDLAKVHIEQLQEEKVKKNIYSILQGTDCHI